MALLTHTIPNLMNGVSQQPVTIRLANQAEEQINGTCRVSDGLSKRLPIEMIRAEEYLQIGAPFTAIQFADETTKMHMVKGVDSAGVSRTCQIALDGVTGSLVYRFLEAPYTRGFWAWNDNYLKTTDKSNIKFLTNGQTTYILNKEITVDMTGGLAPDPELYMVRQGSLGFVKQGFFGTSYICEINIIHRVTGLPHVSVAPQIVTFTTNSSTTTTNITELQVTQIANDATAAAPLRALSKELETKRLANVYLAANTEIVTDDNWFQFKWKLASLEPNDYRIEMKCTSTTAATAIYAVNGVTTDPLTLPKTGPEGYVTKIDADPTAAGDQYYLKYNAINNGWSESGKLTLVEEFDFNTLPYQLDNIIDFIANPSGFTMDHLVIDPRTVGDEETSPNPSFVNNQLNDMFIFNNRLGFLSQNNVIMSRIDEFNTFFRTSVATSLSADRVDLKAAVPSARYTDLHSAVPFETAIMLFGDAAQYVLQTTTGFDVSKTSLQTSTEYEASQKVAPINLGASVYFPVTRGNYSGIFDLSRKDGIGLTAEEATHHIPTYILGDVVEMTYSSVENILFARTNTDKRTIYVQNRFIRQTILEQNAWHKWTVPNDIVYINVLGSHLYICMVADDGISLIRTKADISTTRIIQDNTLVIGFAPLLDYLQLIPQGDTVVIDSYTDYYVAPENEELLVGVDEHGSQYIGLTAINAALIDSDIYVGIPYKFAYTFSEQVPAQSGNGERTVYQYGRLSLRSMKISFVNTGKFDVVITPTGRNPYTNYFTGTILGGLTSLLGRINIATGVYKFPVNARSNEVTITIQSSYPYPCTFNTCEWQGLFTNNAGRM
jgi:hypothetical protein